MMALRIAYTLLLALIWTEFSSSTLGILLFKARIRVKKEDAEFLIFNTSSRNLINNQKLIHDPYGVNIYAGGPRGLYMLKPGKHPALKQVHVPIFASECQSNAPDCDTQYTISLLKEGRNGNPLFMCGSKPEKTICCDVSSEHVPVNCFELMYPTQINDPSLHVGDSLYYTISNGNNDELITSGLYRWTKGKATYSKSRQTEQRYVKILANQGNGSLDGKVYSFYIEQNKNQDPDMPLWIPRVSQICMADRGGSKSVLQYRWTSMLTARLFCGDEKKRFSYTELLDVAVLEAEKWTNTTIYALFKNAYNLRAVCVYKMSDVIRVFTSNNFKPGTETFSSPRPGECVENSPTLASNILKFMESHPEMEQWIKPAQAPLLFGHYHYTHLQVDRVQSKKSGLHNVLLMSLDNGNVHKILEQDGAPFIIAEYEPFKTRTHITSMLLDSKAKKLLVSSSSEVVQIDLHNCGVYGKHCDTCVMARDPYCGWDLMRCSANNGSLLQDVTHGHHSICETDVPKISESRTHSKSDSPSSVPQDSKFYLKCPMESQHASYAWTHRGRRIDCALAEQDCLLLIDSMSEKDEGIYKCIASENGYNRTIVHQKLQMNAASETRMTPVALLCLLFLISVI